MRLFLRISYSFTIHRYFYVNYLRIKNNNNFLGWEKKMKRLAICAVIVLFSSGYAMATGTWTTFNMMPGATWTAIYGISGNTLAGSYADTSYNYHGFLYNMTTQSWTTLNYPGTVYGTHIQGISGNNVVGYYWNAPGYSTNGNGMLYNMTTQSYTSLPIGGGAWAIDGSNVLYGSGPFAAVYNITTQMNTMQFLTPNNATLTGISGSNVVGWYTDNSGNSHGFLSTFNSTTWSSSSTTLDMPGVSGTRLWGIDGSTIVGRYEDASGNEHGILYNMTTQSWSTLDAPGSYYSWIWGISGNNLVGGYYDNNPGEHGFVYTIPEPATLLLLGLGAVMLRRQ